MVVGAVRTAYETRSVRAMRRSKVAAPDADVNMASVIALGALQMVEEEARQGEAREGEGEEGGEGG